MSPTRLLNSVTPQTRYQVGSTALRYYKYRIVKVFGKDEYDKRVLVQIYLMKFFLYIIIQIIGISPDELNAKPGRICTPPYK